MISAALRGEKYPRQRWWHCRCDCGREIDAPTYALTSGDVRSCGCLQAEARQVDITGRRFGSLVALRPTGKSQKGSMLWTFRCDCGHEEDFTAESVLRGGRKSCGCKRREVKAGLAREMRKKFSSGAIDGTNVLLLKNQKLPTNNVSGVKGVSWHSHQKKWQARITFKGKTYSLGYYSTIEAAAQARAQAEKEMFAPVVEKWEKENNHEKNDL